MNERVALATLLRIDLRFFVWKSFQTILPGTPYLRNWHIDAIVHQLMRVQGGEISRLLINQPPRADPRPRRGLLRDEIAPIVDGLADEAGSRRSPRAGARRAHARAGSGRAAAAPERRSRPLT